MSADVVNLRAQVEAVLGSLVKAATVELIKVFEGRFRATARGPDGEQTFEVTNRVSPEGTKRSVGVQVDTHGTLALPVSPELLCRHGFGQAGLSSVTFAVVHERSTSCTALVRAHSFQRRVEECATL